MSHDKIPLHDFSKDDSTSIPFRILPLDRKDQYDFSEPHRHNYYEIFFFAKGGGNHRIDFDDLEIKDHSLQFVSPGQIHVVSRALDSHGLVLLFSRDFFYLNQQNKDILYELPFFHTAGMMQQISLSPEQFEGLLREAVSMREEYDSGDAAREEIIRSLLNVLLIRCKRYYEQQKPLQHDSVDRSAARLYQLFRISLEKNFAQLHKVGDYAEELAITEKYLNEICKKTVGNTASSLIQDRILLEAKRLLFHTDLSGKEIAYFLHFEDPSHFGKFFRNKTGLSPGDFRDGARAE
jgi:AraC family transcriptional activator of pobA